jgi:transcriptional regulator with XRE-family HTH domain
VSRNIHPIVEKLKQRRLDLRKSQTNLAEEIGTTQSAVSDIENGSNVTLGVLIRMATALDMRLVLEDGPTVEDQMLKELKKISSLLEEKL